MISRGNRLNTTAVEHVRHKPCEGSCWQNICSCSRNPSVSPGWEPRTVRRVFQLNRSLTSVSGHICTHTCSRSDVGCHMLEKSSSSFLSPSYSSHLFAFWVPLWPLSGGWGAGVPALKAESLRLAVIPILTTGCRNLVTVSGYLSCWGSKFLWLQIN